MNDYKFGNFLCSLREGKGFTQAELAQILSVTPAAVSKWENGESKPRLETLFKLAEIFNVTAEELMSGEFAKKDDEIIDNINIRRYEYLTQLDRLLSSKVRVLRACAFVLDWNIMGVPMIVWMLTVFFLYPAQGISPSESDIVKLFVCMIVLLLSWLCCFVLRDFIFKGRSLGKRIFGLTIIDRNSGGIPNKKQLVLRNVFLFLYSIDGMIMLTRGISIGDSVGQTLVVQKKELEENKTEFTDGINSINGYVPVKKEKKNTLILLACGFALYIVLAFAMYSFIFSVEKSEPYQVAYNYLVESDSFRNLGVDEDRIKWSSISGKGIINKSDTNEITFLVEGKEYKVVSHNENGVWSVCKGCTNFS